MLLRHGAYRKLLVSYHHSLFLELILFFLPVYFCLFVFLVCVFYVITIHSILRYLPMFHDSVSFISGVTPISRFYRNLSQTLLTCLSRLLSPLPGYTELSCQHGDLLSTPSEESLHFSRVLEPLFLRPHVFLFLVFIPNFHGPYPPQAFLRKTYMEVKMI